MQAIYAESVVSMDEFTRDPALVLEQSEGEPVVIFNHDHPTAYLISADYYEALLDALDDAVLADLVKQRQGQERIKVDINEL